MIRTRNLWRNIKKAAKQPGYAAQVLSRRSRIALAYAKGDGESPFPEALTFFLVHRCNLRCHMCGQWGDGGASFSLPQAALQAELSPDEINRVLDDVGKWRPNITLFGGEPTLHRYFLDVLRGMKARGLHCTLISNGSMLPRQAEGMVEAGLDELNLSVDGPPAMHDEVRRVPGLFNTIVQGIEKVREAQARTGKTRPIVNLTFAINHKSAHTIREMVPLARDVLKADSLNLHHLLFISPDIFEEERLRFADVFNGDIHGWRGFISEDYKKIDPDRVAEDIRWATEGDHGIAVTVYPNLPAEELPGYYRDPRFVSKAYAPRCLSPWMVSYIFPDGEVRPCLDFSIGLGSVREKPFTEIWNSDPYKKFRQEVRQRGTFSVCTKCTELYRY